MFFLSKDPDMRIFILILEPSVAQWAACQVSLSNECNKLSVIVCEVVSFLVHGFSIAPVMYCIIKQAYKRGLRYPKHQFPILGASGGSWLSDRDPTSDLDCTLEERIQTFEFALSVTLPDFRVGESLTPTFGVRV